PGQARVDWEVVQDIANRIGLDWHYSSPSEVFDEMVALMPSYKNLRHDNLGLSGKLYPNDDPETLDGTIVMFDERFNTDDGLAHLVPAHWLPAKELPDGEYPLVLNTGRLLDDPPVVRAGHHLADRRGVHAPEGRGRPRAGARPDGHGPLPPGDDRVAG